MMAQTLGGRLEGRHGDIIANKPTSAPTPYPVVYDELAAYVSVGTKEQLQQGRGLGFMFVLGWHDVAGLAPRSATSRTPSSTTPTCRSSCGRTKED